MQEEIRILIIEDEEIWARSIALHLNEFGYKVAGHAPTFEQAIVLLNANQFDLALLDIGLNDSNSGIELGKMLKTLYKKPFIFITATAESNAVKSAIEAGPSAFLTKPFNPTTLFVAIQNAINNFSTPELSATTTTSKEETFFFVKLGDKYKKTNWTDVVFLRSDKNYTTFFNAADKREYSIRCTLIKTLKSLIPESLKNKFVQINRSEAIQVSYIQEIANEEIRTTFGAFTVTEGYTRELKNLIQVIT
jgi:DNA-binding LytR/AlgR family response regulator